MNYLKIAHEACDLSRQVILKYFRSDIGVTWKKDQTPVTIADQEAEAVMRDFLKQKTPGFGFIGEEYGSSEMSQEFNWIIDPIDGTKSFIKGVPLFGTLLALYHGKTPILGIIDLPALNSRLWAEVGQGAWVDGRKAQVSNIANLADSTLLTGTVNTIEDLGLAKAFNPMRKKAKLYRGWGDCYGYYLVATGQAEAMFDPVVSIWDIAPMVPILQEAGGRFSDIKGRAALLEKILQGEPVGSDNFTGLATNGHIHREMLKGFE